MGLRPMGAALVAALAGCGGGEPAEGDGGGASVDAAAAGDASRFEVTVDTQRLAADTAGAPSENPED